MSSATYGDDDGRSTRRRGHMVEAHLAGRGISDRRVTASFPRGSSRSVHDPKLVGCPPILRCPSAKGKQPSQPYIVALTVDALELHGGERVLEVGTGSGYAAAILSWIAGEVYTVERLDSLASAARERLSALGYENVHVLSGDGSLGWPGHAPYDAIAVAAGGPKVPEALLSQLAIGGRMVIPVGPGSIVADPDTRHSRERDRVPRGVDRRRPAFVPLIGEQGWRDRSPVLRAVGSSSRPRAISELVREAAEPIEAIDRIIRRRCHPRAQWGSSCRSSRRGDDMARANSIECALASARSSSVMIEFQFVAVEADCPTRRASTTT